MLREIDYTGFNFDDPNYESINQQRDALAAELKNLDRDSSELRDYKEQYAEDPWLFINHWAHTYDEQQFEKLVVPFVPRPAGRQKEAVLWLYERFTESESGVLEARQGYGATWLSVYFAVWLFLFRPNVLIGFGACRKDDLDDRDNLESVFQRIQLVLERVPDFLLPEEFRPARKQVRKFHTNMNFTNPSNRARIAGEARQDIGTGEYSIYFLLNMTLKSAGTIKLKRFLRTACRIDISQPPVSGCTPGQKIFTF